MTIKNQGGVSSSRKHIIRAPEGHTNPTQQEKTRLELKNFSPKNHEKFRFYQAIQDQISPEETGIPNSAAVRLLSSLFYNYYNEPNSAVSAKLLIQMQNYKFYYSNISQERGGKERKRARKQILFKLIGPHYSNDEVFRPVSYLISIPSNLFELPDKVVQNRFSISYEGSKIQYKFTTSQININQWNNFFRTIDKISSYNFSPSRWFQICEQKIFEVGDEIYQPDKYEDKKWLHNGLLDIKYTQGLPLIYMNTLTLEKYKYNKINTIKAAAEIFNYAFTLCKDLTPDNRTRLLKSMIKNYRQEEKEIHRVGPQKLIQLLWKSIKETEKGEIFAMVQKNRLKLDIVKTPYIRARDEMPIEIRKELMIVERVLRIHNKTKEREIETHYAQRSSKEG
jgi:hypothetical protein